MKTFEEYNTKDPKQLAQEVFDELIDMHGTEIKSLSSSELMYMLKMRGIKGGAASKVSKEILRLAKSIKESVITEDVYADLEGAISDMEPDAYQNLALEFGIDAEDPDMMQDFIENQLDKKGAKLLIKNIKKGVYESYDGTVSDFRYEIEMAIENELGINPVAVKKVSKKGKGFEVRMSSYMSNPDAWKKLGDAIGAELKSFKKGSINIGIYESISLNEANKDGTISDDEDERRDQLEMEIYQRAEELVNYIKEEAQEIGGPFRGPGIISDCLKQVSDAFRKNKMKLR
jgi:hypothetical protein